MRAVFLLLLCSFLFSGCCFDAGDGTTTPGDGGQDDENYTGAGGSGVSVVVDPQHNVTLSQNDSGHVPPPPPVDVTEIDYTEEHAAMFTIYFIHVGDDRLGVQGDAILVKKGDFDMLIDAGSAQTSARVVDFLKARNVDDLDVLMLTNGKPDHYGGIPAVVSQFPVEEFWWAGTEVFTDSDYADAVESATQKAEMTREIEAGYFRELNNMSFTILNPPHERFADLNNDGIVTLVRDRNFTILLMSSVQTGAHNKLINQYRDRINVDVLQAPFNGLGGGTQNFGIFLVSSMPEVVIVSGSSDDSPEAGGSREPFFRYLVQYNITSYETYTGGTVRVTSDGYEYDVAYLG
ncbi:MAG: MBL fold metallo-hydrolase [Candidatus Micrarchaeota archaeon]